MHRYRSHTCGDLRETDALQPTRLSGWCHRIRDHGGVLFIDLRDHYGITQCVVDPDSGAFPLAEKLRSEWVVRIDGLVRQRPAGTENIEMPTGLIEVYVTEIEVLGAAAELPLPVFGDQNYPEDMRLRYRFLDLRREKLHNNIMLRGRVIDSLRARMKGQGFFEFQTPILTASSPEGARDFLVPSRLHPGKFYALPQAPQQFKQLLMTAGFDRYFQIAPCFRDEDLRADRSLEFYQLDIEMSFVTQEDIFATVEPVLRGVFEEFGEGFAVTPEFPRIPYAETMLKYGTDKPDLRNPLVIVDVTEEFSREDVSFNAFKNVIKQGGVVRAIPAPGAGAQPRSFFDKLNDWARGEGAAGLGYVIFEGDAGALVGKGPIAKFLPADVQQAIAAKAGLKSGDAVFFACDRPDRAAKLAGAARLRIGSELKLSKTGVFELCWIVDFPMYEWNEDEKRIDFSHNPFSMPNCNLEQFLALETGVREEIVGIDRGERNRDLNESNELRKRILEITAFQYDVVCNGFELSSGAIRNHRPDIMRKAFALAGYDETVLEQKFGGMYRAFHYGAPPHGGIAPGVDRIVMLLAGEENLREIVAFPMNQRGEDLLLGAPSNVTAKQLRELSIKLNLPEK
ncbi:aspartyl-tRNA synthetase [Methylocella silvestris BL2]|uniref:Aspartate--tRNA(Asp/Asn) ligase n=1 Tax=Methylocella silvestris (strain DSM 15510 / CIP 108128 / LMG 27833 / NCIMB 13906 / BL2) TaxID=395965 RepID=SYDND_METSB|nr:aspartate--tRNA ligase [Methylocella silvestris]B8EN55.1 RecName: Full=Aspartate--tRNA(Asp/Asn) ligase; AltName: Full=Aspartyl-tRNA synthetase; Short=AspRS; AltName: Full=Non-discriminating aspartyl-tRNA synthetase; Short=ND-AspRS [Methylocella silvestris BL2]ACK49190.1 aspartyl-tRNA synthetase [Methylocella silvestris BL2]